MINEKTTVKDLKNQELVEKFKNDFFADVQARRQRHAIMNYSYLQYKGILALNLVYGKEYLSSIGLQVNIPRTWMTIETLRSRLSTRPFIINTKSRNKTGAGNKIKSKYLLKGEWDRSKAQNEKNDAEFDALWGGNGYLLSYFEDDTLITDVFAGSDEEGKAIFKKDTLTRYKGMKVRRINPYYVFPDRNATTDTPGQPGSWQHGYVYSVWDFDAWKLKCEQKGFNTEGMEKGGHLEEFDAIRRQIDAIYSESNTNRGNQQINDNGQVVSVQSTLPKQDWSNKIMVVERFEEETYTVCSGKNWTLNYQGKNPDPDKIIPIFVLRDYRIPDEFDGIGEPELLRWQQYTENKVHNLAYLNILVNTVQRYGVVEDFLKDPTEVRSSNPLKPIRLKNIPGLKINDAIQALNQGKGTQYPKDYLDEVKTIGQMATGVTDYMTGANESQTDTLGEAEMMTGAGTKRIDSKLSEMEERDLVPLLEHWLVCFPQYYTEEMDLLLNDNVDEEFYVKYLPYIRKFNDDPATVAKLALKEGSMQAETIEEVYLNKGYKEVAFVDDIIGDYDVTIKTISFDSDRKRILGEFTQAIALMNQVNVNNINSGQPATWDVDKLTEEVLNQFPEIIKNVDDYKITPEQETQIMTGQNAGVSQQTMSPIGQQETSSLI